ncbi:predicted protein [Uncinocarpus reesii 1704]|uniref:Uncharacterized protein n=1 Tax=Uncinocarpus reesii (strain UAMH 1704) TaxID=336963 RepID=C4JQU8_UNCRE|nr:uncharacterized protein UREG_03430 [Uncinocarpus reesii 1704]EEP78584.1 predicted protein [Uncinocarpus reesii 1704]
MAVKDQFQLKPDRYPETQIERQGQRQPDWCWINSSLQVSGDNSTQFLQPTARDRLSAQVDPLWRTMDDIQQVASTDVDITLDYLLAKTS